MAKYTQIGGEMVPFRSTHLGGTACACGTASTAVTVPDGATNAFIHAAGAAVYWNVTGTSAGTVSPGYAAKDTVGYIPPIDNMGTVIYVAGGDAAAVAHVEFYQD